MTKKIHEKNKCRVKGQKKVLNRTGEIKEEMNVIATNEM